MLVTRTTVVIETYQITLMEFAISLARGKLSKQATKVNIYFQTVICVTKEV